MRVEGRAERRRAANRRSSWRAARYSSQVAGAASGKPGLRRQARMPAHADHVEQERPAIELAVDRALLADRRDDVVEHVFRDVVVPRLDHVGLDHRRHLDERRLADIDVPGAFLVLGLGDEALDAEALDRRDLVVDAGELGVHRRDAGMQVLDPLIEGRRQRAIRGEGGPDAAARHRTDAGQPEAGHQAAGEKRAPVDGPAPQRVPRRLLQNVFLFPSNRHRIISSVGSRGPCGVRVGGALSASARANSGARTTDAASSRRISQRTLACHFPAPNSDSPTKAGRGAPRLTPRHAGIGSDRSAMPPQQGKISCTPVRSSTPTRISGTSG